jgi:hypothetical protein
MPKFSIKDILVATTQIAAGLGIIIFAGGFAGPNETGIPKAIQSGLLAAGLVLFIGDVMHPFDQGRTSRVLAIVTSAVAILIAMFHQVSTP